MVNSEAFLKIDTKAVPLENMGGSGSGGDGITTEAGRRDGESPCCFFNTCFACRDGRCTALDNNDFHDRPCPFFKTTAQVKKERQDVFDKLLISGRLDLINHYEEVLVDLGIENPGDAGEGPLVIDDDVLAARAEIEAFRKKLEEDESETDGYNRDGLDADKEAAGETEDDYFD